MVRKTTKTLYARNNQKEEVTINDFTPKIVLGKGAFGTVLLVEKKDSKELFAMKSINKVLIYWYRMISSRKIRSNIHAHKKWSSSTSIIHILSVLLMRFRRLTNFISSCNSWVFLLSFRRRLTFSTFEQSEEILIKTSQILCHADHSRPRTSSLKRFHLSWSKTLERSYGW